MRQVTTPPTRGPRPTNPHGTPPGRAPRRARLALAGIAAAVALSSASLLPTAPPAAAAPCTAASAQPALGPSTTVQTGRARLALVPTPQPAPPAAPSSGTSAGPFSSATVLTTTTGLTTSTSHTQAVKLDPDLTLEDLTVRFCDGAYLVSAHLRNGTAPRTQPYAGGGTIILERSSGALESTANPFPSNIPAAPLATMKIPALAGGATVTISATSAVRGVFRVRAVSDAPATVERPAVLPGDGAKVLIISNLQADSVMVNNALLNFATVNTLGAAQLRLDRDDSSVKIPGLYTRSFAIPTKLVETPIKDAYYYLHDVNSTSLSREFKSGGLELCIDFETADTELIGYVKTAVGDWDGGAPDGNADPFQVCILLPMSFNPQGQRLFFDSANLSVTSTIRWDFNGPLGDYVASEYATDINDEVEQQFKQMLVGSNVGERLATEFNDAIAILVKGARITDFHLEDGALVIDIQN